MKEDLFTSDRVVLWWHGPDGPLPMFNSVGIFRLMQRWAGDDTVIFDCLLPRAWNFIHGVDINTILDVRYCDRGRMDNPRAGTVLFYIRDIVPKERWVNFLSSPRYDSRVLSMKLHAVCRIDIVREYD